MGMFDSIRCDYPLPLPLEVIDIIPDVYDNEFQTKDFENTLELYILNEDGDLLYRKRQYRWVDDDSAFLKGYMDVTKEEIVPYDFHGVVNFYCYETVRDEQDGKKATDILIDYLAKFTNGKLENIQILSYEISDATERLDSLQKNMAESARKAKLWYNKYFFNTKLYRFIKWKIIIKPIELLRKLLDKVYWLLVRYI
jgi:hypothetical protein